MSIKKFSIMLITIVLLLLSAGISLALTEDIEIVKEDISPSVVEPGGDLTVSISVWNKGGDVEDVTVELTEDFPFTLKSVSQDLTKAFSLCAGCKITNTYFLTIDHNAVSGIYKLQFLVTQAGAGEKRELDVQVEGEPDVVFDVLNISEDITPNSEFNVLINLKNQGTGVARDIKLISDSNEFIMQGTGLIFVDELAPDESRQLELTFLAGSSLIKDVYSIPIKIEFEDHEGKLYSATQDISVRVVHKAELNLKEVKIEPSKIKPGDDITIQIRIENVGEGDAKNIRVILESEIEGSKESYLGKLEKDDDSPAFFSGRVLSAGEKADTLIINYEDDLGQHSLKQTISYTVRGVSIATIVIIVLVIITLVLSGLLVFSYFYRFCKCHILGKKCPAFKEHVKEVGVAVGALKPKKKEESESSK